MILLSLSKVNRVPDNIVVCRTDNLGDFITTLPVCERLKKNNAKFITMVGKQAQKSLADNNPFIDRFICIEEPVEQIVQTFAEIKPDAVINAVNTENIYSLLKKLKSIPIRIGPAGNVKFALRYSHPVLQKRSRSIKSEAEYNLDLCGVFPITDYTPVFPKIYFGATETEDFMRQFSSIDSIQLQFGKYVIMHCGMRGSALNISDDTYFKVLEYLTDNCIQTILTGNMDSEQKQIYGLISRLSDSQKTYTINTCGKFSLRELCCLMKSARCYIGASTGTTHLAAACGTPVIAYYPPLKTLSAVRWAPLNPEKFILSPDIICPQKIRCAGERCTYYNCMNHITADQIVQLLKNRFM